MTIRMTEKNINEPQTLYIKYVCEYINSDIIDNEKTLLLYDLYFKKTTMDKTQNSINEKYSILKKLTQMYENNN